MHSQWSLISNFGTRNILPRVIIGGGIGSRHWERGSSFTLSKTSLVKPNLISVSVIFSNSVLILCVVSENSAAVTAETGVLGAAAIDAQLRGCALDEAVEAVEDNIDEKSERVSDNRIKKSIFIYVIKKVGIHLVKY